MEEEIADYALDYAQSKKVEYAEVRAQSQVQDRIILRNGIVEAYASAVDSGFCVRIIANGGIGFASTNKWSKEEARASVELAFKYAKAAKRKDKLVFAKEKGIEAKWSVGQKRKIENVAPEEKISAFADVDKALASCGVKVAATISQCSMDLITKYIVNSEGSRISSFVPKIGAYIFITVVEQGKTEQGYEQFGYSGGW
jgi:TldD protein